ncbi:MAG: patatin-like phospholipase family protein [Gemmataceae bacterium]|nr:patatin-like phospholipase family protein [Gemmataceae bacterium]
MPRPRTRILPFLMLLAVTACISVGCRRRVDTLCPTPAQVGYHTRDLIDVAAQKEQDDLTPPNQLLAIAERLRKERQENLEKIAKQEGKTQTKGKERSVLCLSGGGAHGAYTVGILSGWTERGDRPEFDVVTGISTGALIAPFAFLGPKYDHVPRTMYTNTRADQIYRSKPLSFIFGEAIADNSPFAARLASVLTPEVMSDLADAYRAGRRCYVGTTENEGKRFVVWDLTAIAARGCPDDRQLIHKILMGSASPPGIFPSSKIEVMIDGVCHTERHVDGGVSLEVFFRPPYVKPEDQSNVALRDLAGVKVYIVLAGKLYADPEVIQPRGFTQASKSVSTLIYAQTRGDVQRLYTQCVLTGMEFHLNAIPEAYVTPISSAEIDPVGMTQIFEEGRRVIQSKDPWRKTPPGFEANETPLARQGTILTHIPRGPQFPIKGPDTRLIQPRAGAFVPTPSPAEPGKKE